MSTAGKSGVFTAMIAAPLEVRDTDNATFISVMPVSGTTEILGNLRLFGLESSAIVLPTGMSFTWPAANQSAPISGLTITPVGGNTAIMAW